MLDATRAGLEVLILVTVQTREALVPFLLLSHGNFASLYVLEVHLCSLKVSMEAGQFLLNAPLRSQGTIKLLHNLAKYKLFPSIYTDMDNDKRG